MSGYPDGNFQEALKLINNSDEEKFNTEMLIKWMRSCFKGSLIENTKNNVDGLNDLVATLSKIGREKQKNFLNYVLKISRYCILMHYDQMGLLKLTQEEADFLQKFFLFINPLNIEDVQKEINTSIYHIERNANASILFMDLSLKMHKLLIRK